MLGYVLAWALMIAAFLVAWRRAHKMSRREAGIAAITVFILSAIIALWTIRLLLGF